MSLRELFETEQPWEPVSRTSAIGWLAFYSLFLIYALTHENGFWPIDTINLIAHEAGHALFSWFGETASLYGGTLLQFFVPLALACYFWLRRKTTAVVFTLFWAFENCLYTGTYMADARAQVLPLVTVGDPEAGGHDWFVIFSRWGLLRYDVAIGTASRIIGWLGMLAALGGLVYRHRQSTKWSSGRGA